MPRSRFCHPPNIAKLDSRGFSILEVLMAVSIGAGVISVLATALMRQVALQEQTNRLTAVEAVVSADLDWFSNYARLWKLRTGSYPVNTDVTMTAAFSKGGAASYEPSDADCTSGLAASLLADGSKMYGSTSSSLKLFKPPYEIKVNGTLSIPVTGGRVSGLNVVRDVDAVGNNIRVFYSLEGPNADGLNFSREASFLVEAAAWCDRMS